MSPWAQFYKDRVGSTGYLNHVLFKYASFIEAIAAEIRPGDYVVEAGCGLGSITRLLTQVKPDARYKAFDLDRDMVNLAYTNLADTGASVSLGDARFPVARADVIHSHGVLEHFDDDTIRQVIAAQRDSGARVAIHYVPGAKYVKPSFGDERLLWPWDWARICRPTTVQVFNEGFDYALIWRFDATDKH